MKRLCALCVCACLIYNSILAGAGEVFIQHWGGGVLELTCMHLPVLQSVM